MIFGGSLVYYLFFLLLLLLIDHAEATADGRRTKRTDEEGAGHLLAVLSDQPVHCHAAAHLRSTQALRAEGSSQLTRMLDLKWRLRSHCRAPALSVRSSPARSSRARRTCVAACVMRSSSAATTGQAPPRRRRLRCFTSS